MARDSLGKVSCLFACRSWVVAVEKHPKLLLFVMLSFSCGSTFTLLFCNRPFSYFPFIFLNKNSGKSKVQGTGSFDDDSEYASSRYVPPLKSTLMDLVSNQLSIDDYPSVVPMPQLPSTKSTGAASARRRGKGADGTASARKKKGATEKWNRTGTTGAATKTTTTFTGGRNIVFMVGGLSFSELRVAREVMEKESREIIVGSTKFLSPNEFMKDLATLNKA